MKSLETERGVVDTRHTRRNIGTAERLERYKSIFQAVTGRYVRARQSQPVVAMNMDPNPANQSKRMTVDEVHFSCDVERLTERALGNRLDLQAAFFSLLTGKPVPVEVAREVYTLCGRAYTGKVEPHVYFAKDRYAHRRPK